MKRLTAAVSVFLLLLIIIPSAQAKSKQKYNFQYLFKWTASAMGIEIDLKKPRPLLKMMPEKELVLLHKKEGGKLEEIGKDGKKIKLRLCAFYVRRENTIYMRDETDEQEETSEETIVHELVHYFQELYLPPESDFSCLTKPAPYWNCPWEREARTIEKYFRLKHGLTITDEDFKDMDLRFFIR